MTDEKNFIKSGNALVGITLKQGECKEILKRHNNSLTFSVWTMAGTVLAACTSPIFSDIADLAGGGGGGDTQSGATVPARTFDGPVDGARFFIDNDDDGIYTEGPDTDLGTTNGVGRAEIAPPQIGAVVYADVNGALDIATGEILSGVWQSLPYDGSGQVLISPLTDLLSRQLDDNKAEADAMGEDAFLQDVLDDILGNELGDAAEITVADVLNHENYNPVGLADASLERQIITTVAIELTVIYENPANLADSAAARTALKTVVSRFTIDTDTMTVSSATAEVQNRLGDAQNRGDFPVVAEVNGGEPINTQEEVDIRVADLLSGSSAERLFGFEDTLAPENDKDSLVGIYIQAQSITSGITVMFGQGSLSDSSDTARGVPAGVDAMRAFNSGQDVFYFVHVDNLGQLIFRPNSDFTTDPDDPTTNAQIRFYVYDGEHATAIVENVAGELLGVGELEIAVANVNDVPVVTPPANPAPITGNTGSASGTFQVSDADGDTDFIWSATPTSTPTGISYGEFRFTNSQGAWEFTLNAQAFDALAAGVNVPLTFDITAEDGSGGVSDAVTLTIMLQGQNDAPSDITTGGAALAVSYDDVDGIPNNGIFIATLSTVDADTGDTHTYTIDEAMLEGEFFSIRDGNGAVSPEGTHLWLDNDADARVVGGTWEVVVTSMDDASEATSKTFSIMRTDAEANLAPTLTQPTAPPAGGYFVEEDSSTSMVSGTLMVADANVADTPASLTVIGVINGGANTLNTQPDSGMISSDADIYAITGSDQRLAGEYGDFILTRSANGQIAWRYEIDEARANSLDENATPTETLLLRVWDDEGLASTNTQTISVEVRGADDAITITSPASDFGPFEVVDTSITDTDDAPTATGTFSASDPDDDITWSATATGANGGLGTVAFIGNDWTFTLTDPAGVRALNALAPDATTDITFDITANGMDAGRNLTITLRGAAGEANLAPTLTPSAPPPAGGYFVAEDSSTSMVNGTLTVADANVADTVASLTVIGVINGQANALNTQPDADTVRDDDDIYAITGSDQRLAGEYGDFILTRSANGQIAWRYEIDEARANSLDETETPTETLLLRVWDDAGLASTNIQTISVEVRGADDAITINSPASDFGPFEVVDTSITNDNDAPTTTGTFSASDPDDDITWSATATGANSGLGTVTFIGNAWTFELTSGPGGGVATLNALAPGATTDITFDITANGMDAGRYLTITLRGAVEEINVAPTLTLTQPTAPPAGGYFVAEDSSTSMVNGTLMVADTNVADTPASLTVIGVINGGANALNTQPASGMISSNDDIYVITGSDQRLAGEYGNFFLTRSANGQIAWRYEIDETLANSLDENATPTETLLLRVWDDDGLASTNTQTISVEVRGADDAATITSPASDFGPFEVVDPSRTITDSAPTATGTFSASDPDDSTITWLATPIGANSGLGTVTFIGNAWEFTLTSTGIRALNDLVSGATTDITFDITANGVNAGTPLTITLKGAAGEINVAPTLTTPAGGYFVVEDSSTSMVSDTLTVADSNMADTVANLTVIGVINGQANALNTQPDPSIDGDDIYAITGSNLEIAGQYGKFVLTRDNTNGQIAWRYEIDETLANSLDENATPTETLSLRVWDDDGLASSIRTISVEVRGANDPLEFDTNNRFAPFEVVDPSRTITNDAPTTTGTFSASDPDDSTITWLATPTGANSGLGTVTFSGNTWRFELTSGPAGGVATLNGLASGQEREITFDISANGVNAGTQLTITLKGAVEEVNVAPTLTTPAGGYFVVEDSSTSMVNDTLTVADTNVADTVASLTVIGVINGQANTLNTQPDPSSDADIYAITGSNLEIAGRYGKFVLTLDNTNGRIEWRYEIDQALANSLDENATPTERLLLRAWDDDGLESSIQTISVEVRGADDAPVFDANNRFSPFEVVDPSRTVTNDAPTATGTFSATDPDDSTITWLATPTGANSGLGMVTFSGNAWRFELTSGPGGGVATLNGLASGQEREITFTITANGVDAGTPLTITLKGAAEEPNVAPTLTTPAGGYFVEEDSSTSMVSDTLTVADSNMADTVASLTVIGVINGQANALDTQPDPSIDGDDIYAITGSNLDIAGQYGKFVLTRDNNNGQIAWRYEIDEALANSLDENATPTETLLLRVWDDDGLESSIRTISVEVRGADDATMITSTSDSGDFGPITVTDPSRTNTGDAPTATGTFSATDPDDSTIRWSATPTGPNSGLGTVTFIGNTWTFELTDPDGIRALNDLVSGDTRPITFDISANGVDAGTPLTITLQGVALPVLGEEANAEKTATEAGHELNNGMTVAAPSIAAMGSFTHTDANAGQGGFVGGTVHIKADGVGDDDTVAANAAYAAGLGRDDASNVIDGTDRGTAIVGTYGTIYLRAGGDWYYVLDDARTDINALPDGASALEDVFDVRIQETVDSTIVSNVLELRIAIAGKNDAPSSITASSTTTTYSGTAPPPGHIIATLTSTDPDSDSTGNTYTYAIDTSSADAPSFRIGGANSNQLQFALSGAVDRNAGDSWTVGVISTASDGLSRTETFTIMRAGNAAPTDIITDVAGTSAALTATYDGDDVPIGGHLVATFSDSIDVNVDDTHRYSIVPSTVDDSGLFTIRGGNQLVLLAGSSPTLGDTLEVTVRTTDAGTGAGGLMFDKTFTITRAGNVSPTDITTTDALTVTYDGNDLPSDGRRVLTLGTTDLNASDSHTYSITGGMHAPSFAISGNELQLATSGGVSVAPGGTWQVTITTTDSGTGVGGLMFEEDFTITRAGNAFPEINTGTSGTAYDSINSRFIADVTDPNRGDTASAPTATGMIVAEDFETAAAAITYSAARAQGETNNYGSITFDSNNPGAWTFTLTTSAQVSDGNDGVTVLNALASATHTAVMDFTVTAADEAGGTDTATLRITLRGAPAAIPPPAITAGDMAGTITDDDIRDHANIPASDSGMITATGSDIEWSSVITGISGLTGDLASRSAADFGSLTLTPSVNGNSVEWVFTPTALINELRAADTNVMITYTITARNGGGEVPTTLTISLNGANDAPVLTQAEHAPPGVIIDKSVMEAGGSNNDVAGDTMARGSLINTDIDMGQSGFGAGRGNTVQGAAGTSPTDADFNALGNDDAEGGKGTRITGVYGDLFLKNDGTWTYELDDDRDATQSLNGPNTNISADRVQDVFTIRVQNIDDTDTKVSNEVEISIDVTGADDDLVLDSLGSLATIDGARVDEIIAELAGPNRGNAYIFGDDNDGVGPNVNQIFTARDPDSRDADLAWSVEALSLPSTADTVYVDLAEYGMFEVDEETGDWRFLFTSAGRRAFDEIDFTGTGVGEDNGLRVIPIRVTVTNDRGISVSDTFEITLEGRAEAPMIADEDSNDFNVIFSTPPKSTLSGEIQAFDPDMPLDPQDPGLVWTHEHTGGDDTLVDFQFMGVLNQSTGFTEGRWTLALTPAGETKLSQRGGAREDITYRITVTDNNDNTDTEDFTITLNPPSSDVPPATGLVDLLPGADVNLQFGYDHFGQGQFGFARGGGALPDASVFTDSGDDNVDIQIGGQLAEPFANSMGQLVVDEPIYLFEQYQAVQVERFGILGTEYEAVPNSRVPVPFRYSTDDSGINVFQNRRDVTYEILNPDELVIDQNIVDDHPAHRDKSSNIGTLRLFPDGRWTYALFTDPGRAGNSGIDYYRITYRRIDSGVIQENDHDIGIESRTGIEISDTYILRINVAPFHPRTFTNTINRFFNEQSEGIITGLFDDVDMTDIRQYSAGGLDAARSGRVAETYVDTTPRGDEVGIFDVDTRTGVFTYNFTGGGRAAIEARLIHTDVGNDPIIKREIPVWGVDNNGNIGTTMVEVSISGLFRLQVQASSPDITSMPDRTGIYPNTLAIGDHRDNTLTLGNPAARNFIFAHEGDDTINLAVDGPNRDSPEDVIYHRFSSAHDSWVNYDGADTINNFDRATDTFILVDRDTGSDVNEPEIFGSGTQLQIHAIFGNAGADKDSLAGFTLRFSNDANSVITFNYLTPRNVSNPAEAARFFGNGRASLDESDGNRITDHGLFEVYFGSGRSFQVIEELPQYLNDYTDTDIIFRPIDDPADQADRFITGAGDGEILIGDSRDNTIRPAGGQDHIVGGRGDDEISLSFGDDSVYHRFSSDSANWINIDGGDYITGFRRREDAFIFLDIDTTSTVDEAAIKGANTELQLFAILEDPATISGVYLVFENDLGGVVRIDYRQDERITITAGNEADFFGTSPNTTSLYNNDGEMLTIRRVTDLSGIGNFFGDNDDQFQVLSQLPRILADILPEISNIGDDIPMDSGTATPGPAIQPFTLSPANEFTHDTLTHGELIFTAFRGGDTTPPTVDRPQVGIELTFGGVPGSGVNVTAIGTGGDVVTIDIVVATDLMDGAQAVTWQTIRDAVNTNGHTAQHVRVSYAAGADGTGAPDAFDTLYADRNGKLSGGEGTPEMPAMDAVALTPDTATFGDLTFTSMIEGDSRLHDVKQVRLIFTDSATGADPIVSVNDSSNSVTDITISVNRDLDATTWDEVLRAYNEHTASTAPNGVTTPAASRVAAITTSTGFDLSQSLGNYFAARPSVDNHFTQAGAAARLVLDGGAGATALVEVAPTFNMLAPRDWPFEFTSVKAGRTWRESDVNPADFAPKIQVDLVFRGGNNRDPLIRPFLVEQQNDDFNPDPNKTRTTLRIAIEVSDNMMNADGTPTTWGQINDLLASNQYIGDDRNNIADGEFFTFRVPDLNVLGEAIVSTDALDADLFGGAGREGVPAQVDVLDVGPLRFSSLEDGAADSSGMRVGRPVQINVSEERFSNEGNQDPGTDYFLTVRDDVVIITIHVSDYKEQVTWQTFVDVFTINPKNLALDSYIKFEVTDSTILNENALNVNSELNVLIRNITITGGRLAEDAIPAVEHRDAVNAIEAMAATPAVRPTSAVGGQQEAEPETAERTIEDPFEDIEPISTVFVPDIPDM